MDRALIFCTAHLQSDPSRYQLWAKYYAEAFKNYDVDLLMVNDGPCKSADKPTEAELIVLEPHLGRPSHLKVPGWKRSFAHALRKAMDRGYRWIGHIESDLYVKPRAIPEFLEHLRRDNGFGSGWCRTYEFPESSLLVLNDKQVNETLINRYESAESWQEEIDFERMLWALGPGRILEGDRYEGCIERLRQDDTYISAIHFRDIERVKRLVDRAIPFSKTLETSGTNIFVAGLATLNRPDCADRCIASLLRGTRVPDHIFVVDNGGKFQNKFGGLVTVLDFGRNLGLAASLNVLRRQSRGCDIVFLNDDVTVSTQTIERMVACPGWFISAHRFSCYLVRAPLFALVGDFDEQFFPLYFEDADFHLRMQNEICDEAPVLAPLPNAMLPAGCNRRRGGIITIEGEPIGHHGNGAQSRSSWMEPLIEQNRSRFVHKWQQVQTHQYEFWDGPFKGSPTPYLCSDRLRDEGRA